MSLLSSAANNKKLPLGKTLEAKANVENSPLGQRRPGTVRRSGRHRCGTSSAQSWLLGDAAMTSPLDSRIKFAVPPKPAGARFANPVHVPVVGSVLSSSVSSSNGGRLREFSW